MWLGSRGNAAQKDAGEKRHSGKRRGAGNRGGWLLSTDGTVSSIPIRPPRPPYATTPGTGQLVLFPTAHMNTLGERMMISFPQVMAGFVMRPWKMRDPNARDHMVLGRST